MSRQDQPFLRNRVAALSCPSRSLVLGGLGGEGGVLLTTLATVSAKARGLLQWSAINTLGRGGSEPACLPCLRASQTGTGTETFPTHWVRRLGPWAVLIGAAGRTPPFADAMLGMLGGGKKWKGRGGQTLKLRHARRVPVFPWVQRLRCLKLSVSVCVCVACEGPKHEKMKPSKNKKNKKGGLELG